MFKRKKKKKRGRKKNKFRNLKQDLSKIYSLWKEHKNIENKDALLESIDKNLGSLNRKNFDQVGVFIVFYSELLSRDDCAHKEKKKRLDRAIEGLGFEQSIVSFNKLWKKKILPSLTRGRGLVFSLSEERLYRYCLQYHLNKLIDEKLILDTDMIKALRLFNISYVEERHLPRMIRAALILDDDAIWKGMLGYYIGLKEEGKTALDLFLQCALKLVRYDVALLLFKKSVEFPCVIDESISTLMVAIVLQPDLECYAKASAANQEFLNMFFDRFSALEILKSAERHHLFQVSRYCILSDQVKVIELDDETLKKIIEIAAVRYDLVLLEKVFQEFSEEKRIAFYTHHVWAYFPPHVLEFNSKKDQVVNIVGYYMEKGLFTFSLEEEIKDPRLLGPRACGMLQKWLSYLTEDTLPHGFGLLREEVTITPCLLTKESKFYRNSSKLLEEHGTAKKDFFYGVDIEGCEFLILYQSNGGQQYPLTTYYRSYNELMLLFVHTDPQCFNSLSQVINELYQEVRGSHFPLLGRIYENFISRKAQVAILKKVARLIWLGHHEHLYYQSSEETYGIIFRALFLCFRLGFCEALKKGFMDDGVLYKFVLSCSDVEDFIEAFPIYFGEVSGDYASCLEKFSSEDEADQMGEICREVRSRLGVPESVLTDARKTLKQLLPDHLFHPSNALGNDSVQAECEEEKGFCTSAS